jgi:hypothetical protein
LTLDAPQVKRVRRAYRGQISPIPITKTRWYDRDLEEAEQIADQGILAPAARLMRAARKDGTYAGVRQIRTEGLVRLPKKFAGPADMLADLETSHARPRSVFDEMFPPAELAQFVGDGIELGVAVAEMLEVPGRSYPVMMRLDPEWLVYVWSENQWYYQTIAGRVAITPGDGRWMLHTPGGRAAPWQNGLWRAIGRAYIDKEHARMHKANWEAKLANPARVAEAPQGATEGQHDTWFRQVMAWGINTVFATKPGYKVSLLESNGRGYESFLETIKLANADLIVAMCGQMVTTTGGSGFVSGDMFKSVTSDLIKSTADALAYTINTQGLPQYVLSEYGEDALSECPVVSWDVTPPSDRNVEANALGSVGTALKALQDSFATSGLQIDMMAFANKFSIPIAPSGESAHAPIFGYHLDRGIVKVDEMRKRLQLMPIGGDEGEKLIGEDNVQTNETESE